MKSYLLFILIAFSACKKETEVARSTNAIEPTIDNVTWKAVFAGSNPSTQFNVKLTADSTLVDKVVLYAVPNSLRWYVNKPQTGDYIMYDHIGGAPKGDYYYFIFYKNDGTEVKTKDFQTY